MTARPLAALALLFALPAQAGVEEARAMMNAGRFSDALAELEPAARSGNAQAEQMIGVMHALGLGTEQDDARAFEWYLRAALKGHPGAQAGLARYFETGRGLPAADPARAYLWYALAAIGGDPDAGESRDTVAAHLSPQEIEKAHELIQDYRVWLYPFR